MNQNNILGSLGIISSSRKLIYGELLFEKIKELKIKLVLICYDMSEGQKEKLIRVCTDNKVDFHVLDNINSIDLSKSIGKFNIKAIGIEDINFKRMLQKNLLEN